MGRALSLATRIIYWNIKRIHKGHLYGSSVFLAKSFVLKNSCKKYAYMK